MDKVRMQGILGKGYGIIPKMLMLDKDINIEAKAIYAYLASFAGNGSNAFPGVYKIISDLNVSEKRFYKYRKQLIAKGYITVEKRRDKNRRDSNLYVLNTVICVPNENFEHSQFERIQNEHIQSERIQNEHIQNVGTNNNSINNNSINNNSINNNRNNSSSSSIQATATATATAISYYKNNIGRKLYKKESDVIEDYSIRLTDELVIRAIDEAIENNALNLKYIKAILNRYEKENKSINDLDNEKFNKQATKKKSNNSFKDYRGQRKYDMDKVRKELLGLE